MRAVRGLGIAHRHCRQLQGEFPRPSRARHVTCRPGLLPPCGRQTAFRVYGADKVNREVGDDNYPGTGAEAFRDVA